MDIKLNEAKYKSLCGVIWGDFDGTGMLISTSAQRQQMYTVDDALFLWLFGAFEPGIIVVITDIDVTIHASSRSSSKFHADSVVKIEEYFKTKPIEELDKIISGRYFLVTSFTKNLPQFVERETITAGNSYFEKALVVQEARELTRVRNAAKIAKSALRNIYVHTLEYDAGNSGDISLVDVSNDLNSAIRDPERLGIKASIDTYEPCFLPAVGSLKLIDTRFPPKTKPGRFFSTVNSCVLGIRYNGVTASIGRTYFYDATDAIKDGWVKLVAARDKAIAAIKVGATLGSVYEAFFDALPSEFQSRAPASIGGFCGVEVATESVSISRGSDFVIPNDCSLVLHFLFDEVEVDGPDAIASYALVDTVQVTGNSTNLLTNNPVEIESLTFVSKVTEKDKERIDFLNDDRPLYERVKENAAKKHSGKKEADEYKALLENMKHSKERQEEDQREEENEVQEDVKHIAYENETLIPSIEKPTSILVFQSKLTVFLPIYGMMVPFHISTIKNVVEETDPNGQMSTLRINFETPKTTENADFQFIREITYTAPGSQCFRSTAKSIKDLRSNFTSRQRRKQNSKDLYKEEELRRIDDPPRIGGNLYMFPSISDKKIIGTLEAHQNGFRYRTGKGHVQLVMYDNIRLALFQKSVTELTTLIHFFLKKPILINGKRTLHVQFFKQVVSSTFNLETGMSSKSESAEMSEEQHDMQVRKNINKEFKKFCKKVSGIKNAAVPQFKEPSRSLSFDGMYNRQLMTFYMMASAIVGVQEKPPFVMMIDDIEVVQFERVMLSLKYFDMVIIPVDWSQPIAQIVQIPSAHLDMIENWLQAVGKQYFKKKFTLDWGKTLQDLSKVGKKQFLEEGGWSAFAEEEEEESPESEPFEEEDVPEEEDDDDGFEAEEETEDDEVPEEDESEEGDDWATLEDKALRSDRKAELKEHLERSRRGGESHHHHHHKHH